MDFVRIENFVFEEADYEMISYKEVKEIKDIFRAFDIKIKDLSIKKIIEINDCLYFITFLYLLKILVQLI